MLLFTESSKQDLIQEYLAIAKKIKFDLKEDEIAERADMLLHIAYSKYEGVTCLLLSILNPLQLSVAVNAIYKSKTKNNKINVLWFIFEVVQDLDILEMLLLLNANFESRIPLVLKALDSSEGMKKLNIYKTLALRTKYQYQVYIQMLNFMLKQKLDAKQEFLMAVEKAFETIDVFYDLSELYYLGRFICPCLELEAYVKGLVPEIKTEKIKQRARLCFFSTLDPGVYYYSDLSIKLDCKKHEVEEHVISAFSAKIIIGTLNPEKELLKIIQSNRIHFLEKDWKNLKNSLNIEQL